MTHISTALNVARRDWFYESNDERIPLGWADVTLNYPARDYIRVGVSVTQTITYWYSWTEIVEPPSDWSQFHSVVPVYALEPNGTISIFGGAITDDYQRDGFYRLLKNQSFVLGDTNSYELTLTESPEWVETSTSELCSSADVFYYLDRSNGSYFMLPSSGNTSGNSIQLRDLPDFPWDWKRIVVKGTRDNIWFNYENLYSDVPELITVPETTFELSYNETARQLESIQVQGDVDDLLSWWSTEGPVTISWLIDSDGQTTVHRLPDLPEFILDSLNITIEDFVPDGAAIYDYDNISGWEEYLAQTRKSNQGTLYSFDRLFYCVHTFESEANNSYQESPVAKFHPVTGNNYRWR